MKILVTGADGQVGKHLSKALSTLNWTAILLNHTDLDVSCEKSVFTLVTKHSPDIIINAAAYTAVDKAETQPEVAYSVNAVGAGFLSSAAKRINAAIIYISTDYVFAGEGQRAYKEEDETAPLNIYGRSKRAGEIEVITTNPKHLVLRTSWVFSELGNNFFRTMLRLGIERDEIPVVADQFGGPTYAGDLADSILKIIAYYEKTQLLDWGIYHYCGYPYVSWFEFAQEIFTQYRSNNAPPTVMPIHSSDFQSAAKRPYNSRLDCTKINAIFGIVPSDWKNVIRKLLP